MNRPATILDADRGACGLASVKPVLFLDIDDVLCLSDPFGGFAALAAVRDQHPNPESVYRQLFAPAAVAALERLDDEAPGIRYVISSTWREAFTRHELVTVFRRTGLGFVAENLAEGERWRTPPKFRCSRRVDEIAQWLDEHHDGAPFAIVDDTHSGASLMPALRPAPPPSSDLPALDHPTKEPPHPFAGRVVLCEENVGLAGDHVPFIAAALCRPLPMRSVTR